MSNLDKMERFLAAEPAGHLKRPLARLQPILAKKGKPNIYIEKLSEVVKGYARLEEVIAVESPEHWEKVVLNLDPEIDAILPMSIPAYPTEVWNSHPQCLIKRGLPVIFWPIMEYDEPDFWRWSARDFLRALGVEVYIAKNIKHGSNLIKSLTMKRFLSGSKLVVFGEQNFPWNAPAGGHLVTQGLGIKIIVRALSDFRRRYEDFSDKQVCELWSKRKGRYVEKGVKAQELDQAIRTYFAIKSILEEEMALGFGVNCFGDLIIAGGRDVPCLAQALLREDGYIAACDGDYIAMTSMVLATYYLDRTCMMSNMYPVGYVGALRDHFGDTLSPDARVYPESEWKNLARLAHCGFVGVVSPEMTPSGKALLKDWGGTYEIKRDGRGCGMDGDLAAGEKFTVLELCFDGKTLLLANGEVLETTRHKNMPHCESSVLLRFRDMEGFVENISREHIVLVYGEHIEDFKVLGEILGLNCKVF
jgi:hypothetical protein